MASWRRVFKKARPANTKDRTTFSTAWDRGSVEHRPQRFRGGQGFQEGQCASTCPVARSSAATLFGWMVANQRGTLSTWRQNISYVLPSGPVAVIIAVTAQGSLLSYCRWLDSSIPLRLSHIRFKTA